MCGGWLAGWLARAGTAWRGVAWQHCRQACVGTGLGSHAAVISAVQSRDGDVPRHLGSPGSSAGVAPRAGHLRLALGGHQKSQGGQPQNFLPAALFVTEPTSQNSRVFPRACLKTPQRRRPSRRRRAKSAAQRDFGVFWALQGQNHRVLALARRGADPHCRAAPTRAGRPEEARGVRRLSRGGPDPPDPPQ